MKEAIENCRELLVKATAMEALIPTDRAPKNFSELYDMALPLELQSELQKLLFLFKDANEETLKTGFLELCAKREKANANTALSFFSLPESDCNQLYLKLAILLFNPKDFSELAKILFPTLQYTYTFDLSYTRDHLSHYRSHLSWEKTSLSSIKLDWTSPNLFSTCVVYGDCLLDLQEIQNFDLHQHQQFASFLKDEHPKLYTQLFQHNDAFQQLALDLNMMDQSGLTPREALIQLKASFVLSGEKYSGDEYNATLSGSIAFTRFLTYLEHLPDVVKQTLLNMRAGDRTLKSIIQGLKYPSGVSNCVETAAASIDKLLQDPENQALLDQRPVLTRDELRGLIKKYHRQSIHIQGLPSKRIPTHLSKELLANLTMDSPEDFVILLLNLPLEEYANFIENMNIHFDLGKSLHLFFHLLTHEQQKTFVLALCQSPDKLNPAGHHELIKCTKDPILALKILETWTFTDSDIAFLLKKAVEQGDLPFVQTIVQAIPRILNVQIETTNSDKQSLIHFAITKPNILHYLLDAKADVNQLTRQGLSALFMASKQGMTEAVRILLAHKADISHVTKENVSAFYIACQYGQTEVVKLFLEEPSLQIDAIGIRKHTPLLVACISPHTRHKRELFKVLVQKANMMIKNDKEQTAIDLAFENKNEAALIELLLKAKQENFSLNDIMSKETLRGINNWKVRSEDIKKEYQTLRNYLHVMKPCQFFSSENKTEKKVQPKLQIANGCSHLLVYFENGKLFGYGNSNYGQLGLDNSDSCATITQIGMDSIGPAGLDEAISKIFAGYLQSAIVTDKNKIYVCGDTYKFGTKANAYDTSELLAPSDRHKFRALILENLAPDESIIDVQLNYNNTLILTDKGRLFGCGHNNAGQLGLGHTKEQTTPVEINIVALDPDETIQAISSYSTHTLALTSKGRVFGSASTNAQYEFGYGNSETTKSRLITNACFNLIPIDHLEPNESIVSIHAGEYYSLLLTEHGKLLASGRNMLIGFDEHFNPRELEIKNHYYPSKQPHSHNVITPISSLEDGEYIQSFYASDHAIFILTNKNRLFASGTGRLDQLGLYENALGKFSEVSLRNFEKDEFIVSLNLESNSTVIRTNKGKFYKAGLTTHLERYEGPEFMPSTLLNTLHEDNLGKENKLDEEQGLMPQ